MQDDFQCHGFRVTENMKSFAERQNYSRKKWSEIHFEKEIFRKF